VEIGKEGRGEEAGGRWGEGRVKLNGRCGLDGEFGWHWDYGIGFQEVVTIRAWLLCQGWKWKATSSCRLHKKTGAALSRVTPVFRQQEARTR